MRRLPLCLAGLLLGATTRVDAQAFTPDKGLFSLTSLYQVVDNTGHRLSDGFMLRDGQSISMAALVESEYGVTERLAVSLGLPYIGAKYRGVGPTPANLPVDSCRCWRPPVRLDARQLPPLPRRGQFRTEVRGARPAAEEQSVDSRRRSQLLARQDGPVRCVLDVCLGNRHPR